MGKIMRIEIAQRLKPFSHQPGTYFILPGSTLRLQIFPALIRIFDLSNNAELGDVRFSIDGPLEQFTISQDLEKGQILVWGKAKHRFIRYRVAAHMQNAGMAITTENVNFSSNWNGVADNRDLFKPLPTARLSLGSHKAQDWALMHRRRDLKEIFPIWNRLGQIVPELEGAGGLLEQCELAVKDGGRDNILNFFYELFLAGFEGGLSPRSQDTDYQGFAQPPLLNGSALALLSKGSTLIRSLFLQINSDEIRFLPLLPPEFHCGRLNQAACGKYGEVDIEWSKKLIRRVIFKAKYTGLVNFNFQKEIKQFRLRTSSQEIKLKACLPIEIQENEFYWFDNFEK